mgnify:CR=1 FL=1|jgi:hypothetical protein
MSSDATFSAFKAFLVAAAAFADGVETRANKRKRERRDANAGEAIPGLLNDIVVTHVLRSEHFDDPADLARLPAVSRAMRDAVAATGLRFEELGEKRAVNLGCFSALQRLALAGRLSRREILCQVAARVGNLEKLKVLRAGGCPWDKRTCTDAAMGGHLEVLQWARAKGCPWDEETCACAAFSGHLELLQWARANGCPCGTSTCSKAAEGGHLDVLQWLHADGCPWDEMKCEAAAWGGYLQVLQWARTNGCPWDDKTCQYAAQSGHLQVLQWARANGCPWNEWTCSQAASGGHLP